MMVIDCCVDAAELDNSGRETLNGSKAMALFKEQIVELASDWIRRDLGVVFSKSWIDCTDRYSGILMIAATCLIFCLSFFFISFLTYFLTSILSTYLANYLSSFHRFCCE